MTDDWVYEDAINSVCPTCRAQVGESCGPQDIYAFMFHHERVTASAAAYAARPSGKGGP